MGITKGLGDGFRYENGEKNGQWQEDCGPGRWLLRVKGSETDKEVGEWRDG